MTISIKGYEVIIDDDDYEKISRYSWSIYGAGKPYFAAYSHVENGKNIKIILHRIILGKSNGMIIDHINGNTLDNRKCNLRFCTKTENSRNRKRNLKSKYKGICFHESTGKWEARIKVNKKSIYLGIYNSPEDAHIAYCKAAKKYHGDFANFG